MGQLSEILASGKPFSKGEIYEVYSDILKNTRRLPGSFQLCATENIKT